MQGLKLTALDAQDLEILSAHMQDAVLKASGLQYLAARQKFILTANRFDWSREAADGALTRRACVLQFARVEAVQSRGMAPQGADAALALLSITFEPAQAPSGHVVLAFAGGATLRLKVECIEAQLADSEAAWLARSKPVHGEG